MTFLEIFMTFIFNLALFLGLKIVELILYPINLIISIGLPSLNNALGHVADYVTLVTSTLGFTISASGIPSFSIALIGAYYLVKLTAPFVVHFLKTALRWLTIISIIRKI